MKGFKIPHLLMILFFSFFAVCSASAQNKVIVTISDGLAGNDALKSKAEQSMSALLSEINTAQYEKRALRLGNLNISLKAKESLAMLWENVPFRCIDSEVIDIAAERGSGYQFRNVPLMLKPTDNITDEDEFHEAAIGFDQNGQITSFYLTISGNIYADIMKTGQEVPDFRRRQLILDYVEQFRTAYNTKDIKFLTQIFSEDALIITGNVVQSKPSDGQYAPAKVTYKVQNKQEYLRNLQNIFNAKKYIRVIFDDIKVVQAKKQNYYGVLLHQGWTSDTYSDTGYVFLLWDFENEDAPQIHVRTWQPDYLDKAKTQPLPKDDIFDITDFDL